MARPSAFRQVDVARAVRAAQSSGLQVMRIDVAPDGKISVITDAGAPPAASPPSPFDEWKAGRDAR